MVFPLSGQEGGGGPGRVMRVNKHPKFQLKVLSSGKQLGKPGDFMNPTGMSGKFQTRKTWEVEGVAEGWRTI